MKTIYIILGVLILIFTTIVGCSVMSGHSILTVIKTMWDSHIFQVLGITTVGVIISAYFIIKGIEK